MKKILYVIFIAVLLSCSEDEPLTDDRGCLTGIPTGQNYRVLIRCCSRSEYLAGSNVQAGGTSNWSAYSAHQWVAVKACGDC